MKLQLEYVKNESKQQGWADEKTRLKLPFLCKTENL